MKRALQILLFFCFAKLGFFSTKLSQRHRQAMLAVVFNSCVQSAKGWLFWNQSSHLICSFLGQKCHLNIQKDPINRLRQGIYKLWRYRNKPVSSLCCQLPSCGMSRTHNSHSMNQEYQQIRKWQLLNNIFLFIPLKSFVRGHFCPSCI